jgi:hypothetical protein
MENWEEKIEQMAKENMREDVRCIAGVPSWTLVLLRRILELTGKRHMLEVWPNLELFMHGGVSFRPYREQFAELFPSTTFTYLESYNASEGFFGIQDRKGADDLLLMLDYGIFFEFVPISEIGRENPSTVLLNDVQVGEQYALVISTNAGLWRYMPGDTGALHEHRSLPHPGERPHTQLHQCVRGRADRGERRSGYQCGLCRHRRGGERLYRRAGLHGTGGTWRARVDRGIRTSARRA